MSVTPNLSDYLQVYKNFAWRDYYPELTWFPGHKLNAAYNAIDRHLGTWRENKIALYWEDESGNIAQYTFRQLADLSNKFANYLKEIKINRGERVFLFLPRIPELYYSFLGVLKTGAVAGTMFSAFQEKAIYDRLENSQARFLITNQELLPRVMKIKRQLPNLEKIIVVDSEDFLEKMRQSSAETHIAQMNPDDDAFMLYTSGTTGKPKGVVHRHLVILHEHLTAKWVLDLHEEDTYWCTADPGWVTGVGYEILGNWSNGASTVVYNGRFNPEKWYEILEKYRVTVWYTAPTAIRMLMATGLDPVKKCDLSRLRYLASVGEPLNPEAVRWGEKAYGLSFHDNWWQTEGGGILIANYPCLKIKPGSMGKPFPGITAAIIDDAGKILPHKQIGNLALRPDWPGMMKKIWRRPTKFDSYFLGPKSDQWYVSGDLAYQDEDGYFWFIGRADDVIKTSGERVGPFEVESALIEHSAVVEAGVIGKPDSLRGEIIKAFVVLNQSAKTKFHTTKQLETLKEEISHYVKTHLAGHAYPREIEFIDKLPKTRSGKIMRRLLKAKEMGLPIGDTSTLEEY